VEEAPLTAVARRVEVELWKWSWGAARGRQRPRSLHPIQLRYALEIEDGVLATDVPWSRA
jgi:hypothetical protein